jgi:hypothetical protein
MYSQAGHLTRHYKPFSRQTAKPAPTPSSVWRLLAAPGFKLTKGNKQ